MIALPEHFCLHLTQTASIRLLQTLPELSGAGLIQCEIWHDTIDATCNCLSYVWGSDNDQKDIIINNKLSRAECAMFTEHYFIAETSVWHRVGLLSPALITRLLPNLAPATPAIENMQYGYADRTEFSFATLCWISTSTTLTWDFPGIPYP
jgi:hypothetical protein